jgi:hypothetical protein
VFERFTDRARRVVVLAQEEARLLNHNYIGTEHILLGLIHEGEGVAALALTGLDISLERVRTEVEEIIGQGDEAPAGHIPFTPRAKKVLELGLREALQLNHNYIGTEHILLGLIREGEGVGAKVLVKLGADLPRVRQQVIQLLSGYQPGPRDVPSSGASLVLPEPPALVGGTPMHCSFCGADLWDIDHYLACDRATICPDCMAAGQRAIEQAASSAEPAFGPVYLPPRISGSEPDDPEASNEVASAFTTLFEESTTREAKVDALEDGAALATVLDEAAARRPSLPGPVRVRVLRIRFLTERRARVRFAFLIGGSELPQDGEAVKVDDRWRVSRETFCRVLAMAGIKCP